MENAKKASNYLKTLLKMDNWEFLDPSKKCS